MIAPSPLILSASRRLRRACRRTPPAVTVTRWPTIADYMRARHPALATPSTGANDFPRSGTFPAAYRPHGSGGDFSDFMEGDRPAEVDHGVND